MSLGFSRLPACLPQVVIVIRSAAAVAAFLGADETLPRASLRKRAARTEEHNPLRQKKLAEVAVTQYGALS